MWVVHIYEVAAAWGESPFETVCVAGPFETVASAERALRDADWTDQGESPRCRLRHAEVLEVGDLPQA